MLKHGNVSRALSWGGMVAVFGLGSLLLPVSPTIGQDAPAQDVAPPTPAPGAPQADQAPNAPVPPTPAAQPPAPSSSDMKTSAIDQSTEKRLAELKILPDDQCSDSVYIRRAYLNLLGVHPDPDSVRAFEEDAAPRLEKRRLLLQKLMAREEPLPGPYARQLLESQKRIDELTFQLQQAEARIAALRAEQDRAAAAQALTGIGAMPGAPANALPQPGPSTINAPLGVSSDANQGRPTGYRVPGIDPRPETVPNPGMGGAAGPVTPPRVVIIGPPNGTVREVGPDGVAREFPQVYRIERAPGEKESERLDKVEAELQALLQEIHAIRAQSAAPRWSAPANAPLPTPAPPIAPGSSTPPLDPARPPELTPGDQPARR